MLDPTLVRRQVSALLAAVLAFFLLTSVTAQAGSHVVFVPPPNGTDDTANIQAALDACVAYGPGCTVQLAAGTYLTKQLVAYNFRGSFKGTGQTQTTIEALPNLLVNFQPDVEGSLCRPEPGKCFWATLVLFVDGNIRVSDLSLIVPATNGTAALPWTFGGAPYSGLAEMMTFTGRRVTANVDRIHFEGRLDPTDQRFGYNVVMALDFNGTFPRSSNPFDWYFNSGSFTVRNSSFSAAFVGVSVWGFILSSHITIGGSPGAGNQVENGYGGFDLETSQSSFFDVSYNQSSGSGAAAWVVPWIPAFVSTSPSQYLIHDNILVATGQYAEGMYLYDNAINPWIEASVWNNSVEVQDTLSEGIGAYNTKSILIWNNNVKGSDGHDGIGLWNSSHDRVIGNNVSEFTVDPTGLAQIYLDPSTTQDLIVCSNPSSTVLNQGTNNIVIGCAASEAVANSVNPATSKPTPSLPKVKPWPR